MSSQSAHPLPVARSLALLSPPKFRSLACIFLLLSVSGTMHASSLIVFALFAISSVVAHPIQQRELRIIGRRLSTKVATVAARASAAEFDALTKGNAEFRNQTDKAVLQKLADDGQGAHS